MLHVKHHVLWTPVASISWEEGLIYSVPCPEGLLTPSQLLVSIHTVVAGSTSESLGVYLLLLCLSVCLPACQPVTGLVDGAMSSGTWQAGGSVQELDSPSPPTGWVPVLAFCPLGKCLWSVTVSSIDGHGRRDGEVIRWEVLPVVVSLWSDPAIV